MKLILALALLLLPAAAAAGETVTAITATAWSYHVERKEADCEFNPGIGIEHGRKLRMHVGVYSNSDCRFSGFAGFSYSEPIGGRWRLGGAVLGFTGYHSEKKGDDGKVRREDKVKLAPMLVLGYEGKKRGINIGFIPGEQILAKLGLKDDDQGEQFKGLLFVQFKLLKW